MVYKEHLCLYSAAFSMVNKKKHHGIFFFRLIEVKRKMDGAKYATELDEYLLDGGEDLKLGQKFTVHQDRGSRHMHVFKMAMSKTWATIWRRTLKLQRFSPSNLTEFGFFMKNIAQNGHNPEN